MPRAIDSSRAIRERPGSTGGAVVSIEFTFDPDAGISQFQMASVLRGAATKMRAIIAASIARSYNASGLRKKTRKLFNFATRGFKMQVQFKGKNRFVLIVRWENPPIPYFFIHLFGGTIKPLTGKFLTFMGNKGHLVRMRQVTIPARPFVKFDRAARAGIEAMLNREAARAPKERRPAARRAVAARERRVRAKRPAPRVSRISGREVRLAAKLAKITRGGVIERNLTTPSGRMTKRTIRRGMRRPPVGAQPSQARQLAEVLFPLRLGPSGIASILQDPKQFVRAAGRIQLFLSTGKVGK